MIADEEKYRTEAKKKAEDDADALKAKEEASAAAVADEAAAAGANAAAVATGVASSSPSAAAVGETDIAAVLDAGEPFVPADQVLSETPAAPKVRVLCRSFVVVLRWMSHHCCSWCYWARPWRTL